ncbi:MAG: hypothetical protein ACYC0F_02950 [Rhodanobacter sp.]
MKKRIGRQIGRDCTMGSPNDAGMQDRKYRVEISCGMQACLSGCSPGLREGFPA